MSRENQDQHKQFYYTIRDLLRKLENQRQSFLKEYRKRQIITLVASLLLIPVLLYYDYHQNFVKRNEQIPLSAVFLCSIAYWMRGPVRQYVHSYKKETLPEIANSLGDFNYHRRKRIEKKDLEPSGIFPKNDRYKSEDYFQGEFKKTSIEFSEVDIQKKRFWSPKKRGSYKSIYKGLAVLIKLDKKKFNGQTVVLRNSPNLIERLKESQYKLQKMNLVSPEFEKAFDAYSSDQVEGRYLIDPVVIEGFSNLYRLFFGKELSASFYDGNKLLVLIKSDYNHFEPPKISTKATEVKDVLRLHKEVYNILRIVEYLNLHSRDHIEQNNN